MSSIRTVLYNRWYNMMARCHNKKIKNFKNYGGRGIKVCERWRIFENFYEDMKVGFARHLYLDRKDVNGDYSPDNCRWATIEEQSNNKRDRVEIIWLEFGKSAKEWADFLGVASQDREIFLSSLRYGLSVPEAVCRTRLIDYKSYRPRNKRG